MLKQFFSVSNVFLSLLLFSSTFSHLCEKVLDIVSKWLALFLRTIYLNFNCTRLKNIYHFPVAANTRAHAWHKSHEICYYVANFVSCNCSGNCASVLIVLVQLSLRSTVKAAAKGIPLEFIFFSGFFVRGANRRYYAPVCRTVKNSWYSDTANEKWYVASVLSLVLMHIHLWLRIWLCTLF